MTCQKSHKLKPETRLETRKSCRIDFSGPPLSRKHYSISSFSSLYHSETLAINKVPCTFNHLFHLAEWKLSIAKAHLRDPLSWRQWVKEWVSLLCSVFLLNPDSTDSHFGACYIPGILLQQCLFPWLPLQDGSLLQDLSLFFLVPKCISNCKLWLSFPFPLLSPLPAGDFHLDNPWHFKPNCQIGTVTWPRTTSVNGSSFLPVIETWNIVSVALPSTSSLSPVPHRQVLHAQLFLPKWMLPLSEAPKHPCMTFLYCFA